MSASLEKAKQLGVFALERLGEYVELVKVSTEIDGQNLIRRVIGAVVADRPPARDIDDDATQMHKLPISGTHAFTDANQEGDEE
jgi:hypothetical protein